MRHIKAHFMLGVTLFIICSNLIDVKSELTPPYFNLATGRKISATATCGEDTDGPELYCKLVGANTENDHLHYSVIQGQVCDYCDPTIPEKNHSPDHAIDGTESWWQSPPLSRGMKYNEVNLTINFEQEFHVAYLFIRMGNSPRPGLWTLEKSSDYGKNWTSWMHFSDTPADCETYFGKDTYKPITKDDDVICTTDYSKIVPLENGEIVVMLLNDRPSAKNYFKSPVLQEWTRATNIRFRFLRTKNLLGHLMSVARQDPTVTRRYFYSIKDISIGGRCMCNGHANTCDVKDPKSPVRILACHCQHQTCGIQCNECCPGFEQKKWRQNTNERPFECEPCNCHGHTNECVYDEKIDEKGLSLDIHGRYSGGGRCLNCQHNTEGINCNKCKAKFYRPKGKYWNETDVCQACNCDYFFSTGHCAEETGICECRKEFQSPLCDSCAYGYYGYPNCRECECNLNGTDGFHCQAENGECPCKPNFDGSFCKECAEGYYAFPECKACECNQIGSISNDCDLKTGQCKCLSNFGGTQCERCKHGFYEYPDCKYCDCDVQGTTEEVCDKSNGKCICREGFGGPRCDQCQPGYYNYPNCMPCNCSKTGSSVLTCDNSGKCNCISNYAGKQCTLCAAGYFNYPECLPCNCDVHGSEGITCNSDGQCLCYPNFDGKICDSCKEGFYNFPSCEDCNCDPAGVINKFAGCGSVPVGELCKCKERVQGRICNECKPLYWNLNISNPEGCEDCNCWMDGTIAALDTCESKSGQCICKPHTQGRTCKECKDGTWDLDGSSLFGCKDCMCDVGGSWKSECDKVTGQCKCHPRITGRGCTQPLTTHYFPTLHQFQYEYEDGVQPSGTQVRYQYDETDFPGFSSKGYAVFNNIQNEVQNELRVIKSSVYRIVIRYVNSNPENVTANIFIQSENPLEVDQNVTVLFRPTTEPQFVTVSGEKGIIPSAVVLDPGKYTFTTKSNKEVMLDYFVLLPAAYYEASILTRKIQNPCELDKMELCRHYKYPSLKQFESADGIAVPYTLNNNGKPTKIKEFYSDAEHLGIINHIGEIPVLSSGQPKLLYNLDNLKSGRYIFVIDYISTRNHPETFFINLSLDKNKQDYRSTTLYPCLYSTTCRTPITDENGREKVFYLDNSEANPVIIDAEFEDNTMVAILSVTAIPVEMWSIDYVTPSPVCVIHNGQCVTPQFRAVPDSKKIEFEIDHEDRISINKPPYAALNERVKLIHLDHNEPTFTITSRVSEPKRYVILIKYYQPDHPKFNVQYTLTAGKNQYGGMFEISHCPSSSGCRGVIRPNGEDWWFDIENDFKFTITNDQKNGVWLDYLVIVPVDQYNDDLLVEETFDQTKEFIRECGQDHFHITHNASQFCKNAVFSLTADYNGGALPCNCNYAGSTSFECHPFGGKCQCKPNVIERQCGACRTGFFGFPDCKPCSCPSTAMCEPTTGECVCPPNVSGELCDKCIENTYGFHQIIGCEDCDCNYMGTLNGNLQCDMFNGSCECRPFVEGRKCDTCVNGFYNFPRCDRCACNVDGTEEEVCNKVDGSCFCKKNVVGADCDQCAEGFYNLEKDNPEGCTECFCFGRTRSCESAYLRVFNISLLKTISLHTAEFNSRIFEFTTLDISPDDLMINETTLQADFALNVQADGKIVYFGVLDFLMNQNSHITAYGGDLAYTLFFTTGFDGKPIMAPDVILVSDHMVIIHSSYEQPSSNDVFKNVVRMVETNFQTVDGSPIKRADFMMVLRSLKMILIKANYWEQTLLTQLSDIYLTLADEDEENMGEYSFLPVEKCHCPPGYVGTSCEDCAPGYYRDSSNGPYGGFCVPCECNGHSDTCNCATGVCTNCQHNTMGDHCEMCVAGYYGNATYGTPLDCIICACPLPHPSNNFATSCEISESGNEIHCECQKGYTGARCESCASGYYGNPETMGDYCKPCECSGNINPNEPDSCDTITGECLRCLNNTSGTACNLCAPGFYGDAVKLKNCQSCDCDELGTLECDSSRGECKCHLNVIGERCDHCMPDHFGFDSGVGCRPCDCGIASNYTQCDAHSGKCECKAGVTGRQCDRCANDHWNYTADGCTPCNCNQGYSRGFGCNAYTGQCQCLPGVIGDRCDACPHRWVLVPDQGCLQCDTCHHALLDITDSLHSKIHPLIEEYQSVALAYFTSQKLNFYDDQFEKLKPEVEALDPKRVNLDPSRREIAKLEDDTKSYVKNINFSIENAIDSRISASVLLKNLTESKAHAMASAKSAHNAINAVEHLADNLEAAANTKIEFALSNAQALLSDMKGTHTDLLPNEQVLLKTTDLLDEIVGLIQPIKEQNNSLNELKSNIGDTSDSLEDLYIWSQQALRKADEADFVNKRNKKDFENSQFGTVMEQHKETEDHLNDAGNYLVNGDLTLQTIEKKLGSLNDILNDLRDLNKNVDDQFQFMDETHLEAKNLTGAAENHANDLSVRAGDLLEQYADMTASAEPALKAATAYSNIAELANTAQDLSTEANILATNASTLTNGIEERAKQAEEQSAELLTKARAALMKVQGDLQPRLNKSASHVESISNLNEATDKRLNEINIVVEQKPADLQRDIWLSSSQNAAEALGVMRDVKALIEPLEKNTPLELEKARNVSKDIDGTTKDISQANIQLETVESNIPKINTYADSVNMLQNEVEVTGQEVGEKLENLKRQIESARRIANDINVGVKFSPSTILELKAPETLPLLASKTKVSNYFRTENPNGLLFFLGNENKTNNRAPAAGSTNNDFMALEVVNGYLILHLDTGNGAEQVTNPKYVADGNWYQAIVDRVGSNVTLTVREQLEDMSVQNYVQRESFSGPNNVFNVDRNSRLFVGGIPPPSDFTQPEDIHSTSFVGEIEDLRIGDEKVGLWNFVYGEENNQGAEPRNTLISDDTPPTGYRFNGHGYVVMNASEYNFKVRSSVQFNFKTGKSTKDGLMFFYGRNKHFMSIEMVKGAVFYRFKLGDYMVSSGSVDVYNDNKWHRVVAERDGRRGLLKVDDVLIFQEEADQKADETIPALKRMFFGGYPGKRNHSAIVESNFDGCIDDVTIAGNKVDLGQHINAVDVKPGCPPKYSTVLAYPAGEQGFLRISNISSSNVFNIDLKFKTIQQDGLIFYATNHDQSSTIGLTVKDGNLAMRTMGAELVSGLRVNDGEEHTVTIHHDSDELSMTVDGYEEKRLSLPTGPLVIDSGDVFFGGLPNNFKPPGRALPTLAYFLGCISDVKINGEIINFAESIEKLHGNINRCPNDIFAYDVSSVPIYYPEQENELAPVSVDGGVDLPVKPHIQSEMKTTTTATPTPTKAPTSFPAQTEIPTTRPTTRTIAPETVAPASGNTIAGVNDLVPGQTTIKPATSKVPKILPLPNKPEDPRCKLPTSPNYDVDFKDAGYRFYSMQEQRLEITSLSFKLRKHYDISLTFRTEYNEGLLFYAADKHHENFIALYIDEGILYHHLKVGSLNAKIQSNTEVNDGQWNKADFVRSQNEIILFINNEKQETVLKLNDQVFNVHYPIYIGGVPKLLEENIKQNIQIGGNASYYNGCIRDIKFDNIALEKEPEVFDVVPCSENIESGYFFHKPTGFIKLFDKFTVGTDFNINFDFRPREPDGLLFSVHGKQAYMILELVDDSLWFTVKTDSKNIVSTNFTLADNASYCDGKWRNVKAVKSKFVITISVDYISAHPGVGAAGSTTTKTNRPLFLGGHQAFHKAPGLKTKKTFKGCIKNIRINDRSVSIQPKHVFGDIWQGVCPME